MSTYAPLLPIILLVVAGLAAMVMSAFVKDGAKVGWFSAASLAGIAVVSGSQWAASPAPQRLLQNAVTIDGFTHFFYTLFCIIGIVTCLIAIPYLDRDNVQRGEFYTLMLFSIAGMFVMVSSDHLITLFLGFETMSLAIYALVGWRRHLLRSNEAVLKYFFLGSLAAAIFLYGIALIYGSAATVNLSVIGNMMGASPALGVNPMFVLGCLMVLVALAFKVAAFPFHMWTPDVYEGAPAPVTAFMATAVKAAAFALLVRIVLALFSKGQLHDIGELVIWNLAILTMFVGNIFALVQTNVKRMLAYSSVAHTGYLLIAVCALPEADAGAAILFYLVSYAFTNLAAIACISFLSGREEHLEDVRDYAGLAWKYPLVGLGLAVSMFSLIGFPPTVGFFAKYYLFIAAVKAGMLPLVIVAIINSILSVFYYLRVIVTLYMAPPTADAAAEAAPIPGAVKVAIAYASVAVIWAGIGTANITTFLPGAAPLLTSAQDSVRSLMAPARPEGANTTDR